MSKETGDDRGHLKTNPASVLCEHEQALLKACQRPYCDGSNMFGWDVWFKEGSHTTKR